MNEKRIWWGVKRVPASCLRSDVLKFFSRLYLNVLRGKIVEIWNRDIRKLSIFIEITLERIPISDRICPIATDNSLSYQPAIHWKSYHPTSNSNSHRHDENIQDPEFDFPQYSTLLFRSIPFQLILFFEQSRSPLCISLRYPPPRHLLLLLRHLIPVIDSSRGTIRIDNDGTHFFKCNSITESNFGDGWIIIVACREEKGRAILVGVGILLE